MSTEVKIKETGGEVIQKKRSAWADMGEKVHTGELGLQVRAQDAISRILMPLKVDDLPAARESLKQVKALRVQIMNDRLALTTIFDKVSARLMQSEKSLDQPIADLSSKIIEVTKEAERLDAIRKAKAEEVSRLKERISVYMNDRNLEYRSRISTQVTVALQKALENDVTPADLPKFIESAKKWLGAADFHHDKPAFPLKHVDHNEWDQILEENYRSNPHAYVEFYYKDLAEKFRDYPIAFANKQDALALEAKEHEAKEKALLAESEQKKIAAALEANSTPLVMGGMSGPVKALKKSFEIEMAETIDSAFAIIKAFAAYRDRCEPKLRVQKWFSITPAQMGKALAAVKCDDNSFQPEGITFKEIDKL